MAEPARESSDFDTRRVLLAGALILAMVAVVAVTAWGFLTALGGTAPAPHGPPRALQPQIEVHPLQDFATYQRREQEELSSYGWIDRNAGVVRIPVERAIDILSARAQAQHDPAAAENDAAR
jgi:hypothetical protein